MVDARGGSASHTGRNCFAWAGGRLGDGFAAQGNILAGPAVVDGLADTFLAGGRPFPELLLACLAAADAAGGDRRGRESAALLIVRDGGGYGGGNDRWIDLRVDHHDDPIGELGRLLELQHLYFDRPAVGEPGADRRGRSRRDPGVSRVDRGRTGQPVRERLRADVGIDVDGPDPAARPYVGQPRPFATGWDERWQQALDEWMSVENLEERAAAPGWIDPRVLAILRSRASG